jgi:putative Mg2+ transporter-C (MgtC) family protein
MEFFRHFEPHYEAVFQIFLAILYGGMVGYERERFKKGAGLRTNILICLGSTLITRVSIQMSVTYGGVGADPGRIAAQIVSGIGFLGAGTIIQDRGSVRGLTTAASIWAVAGIGMAIGAGFYWDALIATIGILITLMYLTKFRPSEMPHQPEDSGKD